MGFLSGAFQVFFLVIFRFHLALGRAVSKDENLDVISTSLVAFCSLPILILGIVKKVIACSAEILGAINP
jgi:hypothetical protein